jgi:hypothetical protein
VRARRTRLLPRPAHQVTVLLGFPDIAAAADAAPDVVRHSPPQLERLDDGVPDEPVQQRAGADPAGWVKPGNVEV